MLAASSDWFWLYVVLGAIALGLVAALAAAVRGWWLGGVWDRLDAILAELRKAGPPAVAVLLALSLASCGGGGGGAGPARLVVTDTAASEAPVAWIAVYAQAFEGDHAMDSQNFQPYTATPLPVADFVIDYTGNELQIGESRGMDVPLADGFYTLFVTWDPGPLAAVDSYWDVHIQHGVTVGVNVHY